MKTICQNHVWRLQIAFSRPIGRRDSVFDLSILTSKSCPLLLYKNINWCYQAFLEFLITFIGEKALTIVCTKGAGYSISYSNVRITGRLALQSHYQSYRMTDRLRKENLSLSLHVICHMHSRHRKQIVWIRYGLAYCLFAWYDIRSSFLAETIHSCLF